MPAPLAAPQLVMYDDFLIEAYCSIAFVPFATVSEQRGSRQKTAEHERQDELYGRCRICCSSSRSSEPMLLCDSCDRAFHQECLHPRLKELPKGEWHCAKCINGALSNLHTRAASVSNFRTVVHDISTFPSLPFKMRFKLLDLFAPVRKPSIKANGHTVAPSTPATPSPRPLKSLPPKMRCKRRRTSASSQPVLGSASSPAVMVDAAVPPPHIRLFAAPARSVVRLARDLQPVAQMLRNEHALHALTVLETHFASVHNADKAPGAVPIQQHDAPSAQPRPVQSLQCTNGNSSRSAASVFPSKLLVTSERDATVAMAVTLSPPKNCKGVSSQKAKIYTHDAVLRNPRPAPSPKCDAAQPPSQEANGIVS